MPEKTKALHIPILCQPSPTINPPANFKSNHFMNQTPIHLISLLPSNPSPCNKLKSPSSIKTEMSWFARSLANSLRLDDDDDDELEHEHHDHHQTSTSEPNSYSPTKNQRDQPDEEEHHNLEDPSRGVKEDLSEFKQTLTRQFWDVASFLAPPPSSNPSTPSHSQTVRSFSDRNRWHPSDQSVSSDISEEEETSDSVGISGNWREYVNFQNKTVSRFSKMASNFIPVGVEEEDGIGAEEEEGNESEEYEVINAVGITEEVLAFARNIAMHPETWLDFPLDEEEDTDDFEMSDAQQEHALAVERFAPRLAALRIELCPGHMSKGYFWKVYFVLLHSRLNKHDAELLSTPQVMAARALWMQELQKSTKQEQGWHGRSISFSKGSSNSLYEDDFVPPTPSYYSQKSFSSERTDFETEKNPIVSSETQIVDKSVIEEKSADKESMAGESSRIIMLHNYEDDEDDWPEEENLESGGYSRTDFHIGSEEDVSFSDLEDDCVPIKSKIVTKGL